MTRFLVLFCALAVFAAPPARAASPGVPDAGQLLVPPPMIEPANPDGSRCFTVVNHAPYTVMGSVMTNYVTDIMGRKARPTTNFRLPPDKAQKYCTQGPYYPGTRIAIILRTIVPTFSCYTVAQGEIEIHGEINGDTTRSWIDCQ